MASREIVWTRTAAKQRRSILAYCGIELVFQSTPFSFFILPRIEHPILQNILNLDQLRSFSIRELPRSSTTVFFYKIEPKRIIITAFWDNRRDPKELYKQLAEGQKE